MICQCNVELVDHPVTICPELLTLTTSVTHNVVSLKNRSVRELVSQETTLLAVDDQSIYLQSGVKTTSFAHHEDCTHK